MNIKICKIRKAAEITGLSVSTLYKCTARNSIPHIKLGGSILFDVSELEAWVDSKKVPVRNTENLSDHG